MEKGTKAAQANLASMEGEAAISIFSPAKLSPKCV